MGIKKNKEASPFFALRFSGCHGYSQKFTDIVSAAIIKYPSRAPGCIINNCNYCGGKPDTHVYTSKLPDGEIKSHCGAYALEIQNIIADDIVEIKKLIREEHEYLLEHEVKINP